MFEFIEKIESISLLEGLKILGVYSGCWLIVHFISCILKDKISSILYRTKKYSQITGEVLHTETEAKQKKELKRDLWFSRLSKNLLVPMEELNARTKLVFAAILYWFLSKLFF